MTSETAQQLKQILKDPIYTDLVDFLTLQLNDLRDINNVRELGSAEDQALELKAQKKAFQKIEEILNTIVFVKDLPDPVKPEENDQGIDASDVET